MAAAAESIRRQTELAKICIKERKDTSTVNTPSTTPNNSSSNSSSSNSNSSSRQDEIDTLLSSTAMTTTSMREYLAHSSRLHRVDQSVNPYMDVETGNHKEEELLDDYSRSSAFKYGDAYEGDEPLADDSSSSSSSRRIRPPRRDSLERIHNGLQALRQGRLPRTNSLPGLHPAGQAQPQPLLEMKRSKSLNNDDSSSSNSNSSNSDDFARAVNEFEQSMRRYLCQRRLSVWWKRVLLGFLVLGAVAVTGAACMGYRTFVNNGGRATKEIKSAPTGKIFIMGSNWSTELEESRTRTRSAPGAKVPTKAAVPILGIEAIERRTKVLQYLLLNAGHKDHRLDLMAKDGGNISALKAEQWMTTHDQQSMIMIDTFYAAHTRDFEGARRKLITRLSHRFDVNQDGAHIVNRFLHAVLYFDRHPQASPSTTSAIMILEPQK